MSDFEIRNPMDFDFRKPIGIAGFGTEGKSLFGWLQKHGAEDITVFDENLLAEQRPEGVRFFPDFRNLDSVEVLFRSPGVNPEKLRKFSGKMTSSTRFFFEFSPTRHVIGVTGTKGKGTTSSLIASIFEKSGKKAFLGGNIGTPVFSFWDEITEESTVILELSSFQLMDLEERSPHIGILLRTSSEHLDWHKDSGEYRRAKETIFCHQEKGDSAVYSADDSVATESSLLSGGEKYGCSKNERQEKGCFVENGKIVVKAGEGEPLQEILPVSDIQLLGDFQLENVTAAVMATFLSGISASSIRDGVRSFRGLPYRIEFRGEKRGIRFYNDSFATIPESTIAALSAFKDVPSVMIILGGSSKNSDYRELGKYIAGMKNMKRLFFFGVTGPEIEKSVQSALADSGGRAEMSQNVFDSKNASLEEIMEKVRIIGEKGDIVLLSPASASFDLFKNYKHRGNVFNALVEKFGKKK